MHGRVVWYGDTNVSNEFTTATFRAEEFTNMKFEKGVDKICRSRRENITGGLSKL
jgi:hypothetical protein